MRAKNVIQLSDFPVRRTGSYRHKKALHRPIVIIYNDPIVWRHVFFSL